MTTATWLVCNVVFPIWTRGLSLQQLKADIRPHPTRDMSTTNDLYSWEPGTKSRPGGPVLYTGAAATDVAERVQETQFRESLDARIIIPSAKLVFCHIPKVASMEFVKMFNQANGKKVLENSPSMSWDFSTPAQQQVDASTITQSNGWKFAVFFRDPLERYLSTFGSKCLPNSRGQVEGEGKNCAHDCVFRELAPLGEIIEAFERIATQDARVGHPPEWNNHWRKQSSHVAMKCGTQFLPQLADFVGDLSAEANPQVKKMFEVTNMTTAEAHALADSFFPRRAIAGHHSASFVDKKIFYRNASVVKKLENLFASDYTRLQLPPFQL